HLRYAGRVGTGFTDSTLDELTEKIEKLESNKSPFSVNNPRGKDIRWIKPKLIAEIEFKTWTSDKILRQASFQGLREDKSMKEIGMKKKKNIQDTKDSVMGIKITHPERIVYPATETKKIDVVRYYEE